MYQVIDKVQLMYSFIHIVMVSDDTIHMTDEVGRGPGRDHIRRNAASYGTGTSADDFGSIIHADYRSARKGMRVSFASAA